MADAAPSSSFLLTVRLAGRGRLKAKAGADEAKAGADDDSPNSGRSVGMPVLSRFIGMASGCDLCTWSSASSEAASTGPADVPAEEEEEANDGNVSALSPLSGSASCISSSGTSSIACAPFNGSGSSSGGGSPATGRMLSLTGSSGLRSLSEPSGDISASTAGQRRNRDPRTVDDWTGGVWVVRCGGGINKEQV